MGHMCLRTHVFGNTCVWEHSGEGENPADEAPKTENAGLVRQNKLLA